VPASQSPFTFAAWRQGYQGRWLLPDGIAGLTVWALLVPEAMAYASVAGVPVQYGLYSVPLAVLGYALFGGSRELFVGPSSTVAVLAASTVAPLAASGSDAYVALIAALSIMVGVLYVAFGLFRLGFVARFFAKPVLDGFIIGLGIFIAVGQLHKVVGLPSVSGDTIEKAWNVVRHVGDWSLTTTAVGAGALVLLFGLERISRKIPGAIVVVAIGLIVSQAADLASHGVKVVGNVPSGFSFVPWSSITLDSVIAMVPGALGIIVVGFAQSIAITKALAADTGEKVNANQEMIGYGMASVGAGLLQGYAPTGSLSKTAAARQAGAKSPLAYLTAGALVVVTVLFLTGLFEQLPEAVLGAIVIHAVSGMIDFGKLRTLRAAKTPDFWAAIGALAGVVAFGILPGLAIGIGLSLVLFVHRLDHPHVAVLGRLPDGNFADVTLNPNARTIDGVLIYRLDAPLIFANADVVVEDLQARARSVHRIVLDMEAVYEVDTQGADALERLARDLSSRAVTLVLARPHAPVRELLERLHVADALGPDGVYATVEAAIGADDQ
jgi:high affinity sulfate transporter 1